MGSQELNELRSFVDAGPIPEDDHVPAEVMQKISQEVCHLRLCDVLFVEMDVETDSSACWADADH